MTKRVGVVHTTESNESYTGDVSVANYLWDKNLPVHDICDGDSSKNMLPMSAGCSGAKGLPKADGYHIEHVGRAGQTAPEWGDTFSEAQLNISAALMAKFVVTYDVPIVHLTGDDVRTGRGIVGHNDITDAYKIRGGHWDPGPNFPWDHYLAKVRFFADAISGETPVIQPPAPLPFTLEEHMLFTTNHKDFGTRTVIIEGDKIADFSNWSVPTGLPNIPLTPAQLVQLRRHFSQSVVG